MPNHPTFLDHTERLRFLGTTLASIAQGVIVADAGRHFVFMNEAGRQLAQRVPLPDVPIEDQAWEFKLRDAEGRALPAEETPLSRALRGESLVDYLVVVGKPDGTEAYLMNNAGPVRDEQGKLVGAFVLFRDVTERLHVEREATEFAGRLRDVNQRLVITSLAAQEAAEREQMLREELAAQNKEIQAQQEALRKAHGELEIRVQERTAEFQAIIDNMVDGVFVCNGQGELTLVNAGGLRLLGLDGFGKLGGNLTAFAGRFQARHLNGKPILPDELPIARALLGDMITLEDAILRNQQTNKDVFVRISAAPIRGEKGEILGAVAVGRDVTELTELDRLKDQFITVAAHELKTPVTGIKGFAQLLLQQEQMGISPSGIKALQAINRQADRIKNLVNDLLEISRLQAGQVEMAKERIDLSELAGDAVDRAALTTTKHSIRVVRSDAVALQGDRERIEEAITNLLDNALKYSPAGGDIEVAVMVEDNQAVVSVKDYGVGIPEDKQARIFQRFYRAHTGTPYDYGGIGVGLYISSEIVARHGGKMWFESEEGEGSTFYFSLPLA